MSKLDLGLTKKELVVFKKLTTPLKIQKFLDSFPRNLEKNGETNMSPRLVLQKKKMHCFEGALVAALALWLGGEPPLLLDLKASRDEDHVVALYKRNGYWGAISKTNHAVLRWRDPVYKNLRELAMSYFHEYTHEQTGRKTLRSFSRPFDLRKIDLSWITDEEDLDWLVQKLDDWPHYNLWPKENARYIRYADDIELKVGQMVEWKKSDRGT